MAHDAPCREKLTMYKLADLMEEHKNELAQLETLDNGKPISETSAGDIPMSIEHMRYYLKLGDKNNKPNDSCKRTLF